MRKIAFAAAIGVCLGLAVVTSDASVSHRTTRLTFSGTVALPGVVLPAGTYLFELPTADSEQKLVRVSSVDRSTIYYTGLTLAVERPLGAPATLRVTFGEAAAGRPLPIAAWYPSGDSQGRQFIYDR